MRIGVLGAGSMGSVLARRLVELGHSVMIANSRGRESLRGLAAELGADAADSTDAVAASELVILALPTKNVTALPRGLFERVPRDTTVIDIGNYHPELRDGRIDAIERGMLDSEWVAAQIGHPVVKAFNTILAEHLRHKGCQRGTLGRIALPVAGDDRAARELVRQVVDDVGFDAVDAGTLGDSWRQQTGTPAYCKDLPAAALVDALARAERSRIREYRTAREAELRAR